MALTIKAVEPREIATALSKARIIIDPEGTVDVEYVYGNYDDKQTFVAVEPRRAWWAKISGARFLELALGSFSGNTTRASEIGRTLDSLVTEMLAAGELKL